MLNKLILGIFNIHTHVYIHIHIYIYIYIYIHAQIASKVISTLSVSLRPIVWDVYKGTLLGIPVFDVEFR